MAEGGLKSNGYLYATREAYFQSNFAARKIKGNPESLPPPLHCRLPSAPMTIGDRERGREVWSKREKKSERARVRKG